MPDPGERNAFLASVRSRLDLPDAIARDVLEELEGHLEDAAADLRAAGLSADDAERRAIGRLGDARALGTELARARRGRRQVLAAVGGGIRAVLAEGIRTWIFLAVLASLTAILALPAASIFAHVLGRSTSSYFGGPIASLATVGAVVGGFAYLGWVLPARIAGRAVRSVFGVRRGVALIGLALGSAVLWFLVPVAMDPVRVVGLPLGPVAFALAALRAPERPTFRVGFVPAVIGAAILFLPMTLLALATTDPPLDNWMADISPIGDAPAATDVENTALGISWSGPDGRGWAEVTVDAGNAAATVATRLPTLRVEIWSARVVDGVVRFGSAPLVAQLAPTEPITILHYALPALRDPQTTMAFVVGIAPDGRRVILDTKLDLTRTPPWTGTLAEWWTGS
ncbi:MAG TPA: permease prefix domain 1-containing protein [Candidatus Limnocylindrales bacterium]